MGTTAYLEILSLVVIFIAAMVLLVRAVTINYTNSKRADIVLILVCFFLALNRVCALLEDWWHPQITYTLARVFVLFAGLCFLFSIKIITKENKI